MNFKTTKKDDLILAYQGLEKAYAEVEPKTKQLEGKVTKLNEVVKEVKEENTALQIKVGKIVTLIQEAFGDITFPTRITWFWAIMNVRTVANLIKGIIEVIRD